MAIRLSSACPSVVGLKRLRCFTSFDLELLRELSRCVVSFTFSYYGGACSRIDRRVVLVPSTAIASSIQVIAVSRLLFYHFCSSELGLFSLVQIVFN